MRVCVSLFFEPRNCTSPRSAFAALPGVESSEQDSQPQTQKHKNSRSPDRSLSSRVAPIVGRVLQSERLFGYRSSSTLKLCPSHHMFHFVSSIRSSRKRVITWSVVHNLDNSCAAQGVANCGWRPRAKHRRNNCGHHFPSISQAVQGWEPISYDSCRDTPLNALLRFMELVRCLEVFMPGVLEGRDHRIGRWSGMECGHWES